MSNGFDDKTPILIPREELKKLAAGLAAEMNPATAELPAPLRARFITVRSALYQRGIFDPVLVRFDSISAPPAPVSVVAEQLATIALSL
jgi:hypothetical protein